MTITKNNTNTVGSITVCLDLEASIIKKDMLYENLVTYC